MTLRFALWGMTMERPSGDSGALGESAPNEHGVGLSGRRRFFGAVAGARGDRRQACPVDPHQCVAFEWAVQRARYMTLETIAPLSDDPPSVSGCRQLTCPAMPVNAVITPHQLHHVLDTISCWARECSAESRNPLEAVS